MRVQKKIAAIFLGIIVSVMVLNYFVFGIYIAFNKQSLKSGVWANSNSKKISFKISSKKLFLNKNGLAWNKTDNELWMDGSCYEIASIVTKGDSAQVYLLEDVEETELFKKYFSLTKKDKNTLAELNGLYLSLIFENVQNNYCPNPSFTSSLPYPHSEQHYSFLFHNEFIKPPCILQS